MFIGHFAAGLAAKAKIPSLPLWSLMGACQALDLGWGGLVLAGIEKVRIDPTLKGSPFDLYDMPYTHSLPAAILWSLLAGAITYRLTARGKIAAIGIAATVFSHWLFDLLVHRPDLALGFADIKLGLALWNHPWLELALELAMFLAAALFWWRRTLRPSAVGAFGLLAWLLILQLVDELMPPPQSGMMAALSALAAYITVMLWAWGLERGARTNSAAIRV